MKDEKTIVWLLRLISILVILIPLAFYYLVSNSLQNFLLTVFSSFNPDLRFQITSIWFDNAGENTYFLRIGLLNTGNMMIGLKRFDGRINVPEFDLIGRLTLQSSFTLLPGGEEELNFLFMLERGNPDDFQQIFIQRPVINLSGNATLVLNSAEMPLVFSILLPSG